MMENETSGQNIGQADEVFLLMRRDFRVSRNVRAKWYFQHLGKEIVVEDKTDIDQPKDVDQDLSVVSIVSDGETPYVMKPEAIVTCLSRRYRLVFVLDFSPSSTTIGRGGPSVLYKNLYVCLERCLKSIAQPLKLPGSGFVHTPEIFVTVIAFSPFVNSYSDQVIIQGFPLTLDSVDEIVNLIDGRLTKFVDKLAVSVTEWMLFNHDKQRKTRLIRENDSITGNLFHLASSYSFSTDPSDSLDDGIEDKLTFDPEFDPAPTPSEWTLISLLRLGLVGVQLLPENTQSNIVVLSDGEFCEPNAKVLQELLVQLRSLTVSCSFVQVQASISHNWGRVAYPALLQFLAEATFGAYVPDCECSSGLAKPGLNTYHRHLLCWSFKSSLDEHAHLRNSNPWKELQPINASIRKRVFATTYETSPYNLLYIRLREGYTLDKVLFLKTNGEDENVQLDLRLPWKSDVRVVYSMVSAWPLPTSPSTRVQVYAEGPYEFIRDIINDRPNFTSFYRLSCMEAFKHTILSLRDSDERLLHLHSFKKYDTYFTLPDSVRNAMPLFYLPPNSSSPVISSTDLEEKHPRFCQFWYPVCTLDINIWQKWLHTHVLRFILSPDLPLSPNLHQVSPTSGRYGSVQCRQAVTLVHETLRSLASFTLMEGHSYVKLTTDYFYIIRVCMRPPCLVIKVAFLGGRRGAERELVMSNLRERILALRLKQKTVASEFETVPACISLIKPIERVLVRYSCAPEDLFSIVRLASPTNEELARAVALHNTLARYFTTCRCMWNLARPNPRNSAPVSNEAAAFILQALVRRRLNEGFMFASGSSGIVCLICQLTMDNGRKCLIQYMLFPPASALNKSNIRGRRRISSGGCDSVESDCDPYLVTEIWVEPQHGTIVSPDSPLNGCTHYDVIEKIHDVDRMIVQSLATFEHLNVGCVEAGAMGEHGAHSMGRLSSPMNPSRFRADASRSDQVQPEDSCVIQHDSVFRMASLIECCQQATLLLPTLKPMVGGEKAQKLLLDCVHRELNSSHDIMFRPSTQDTKEMWKVINGRLSKSWMNHGDKIALYCYCKTMSDSRVQVVALVPSVSDLQALRGHIDDPMVMPMFVFDCYTPSFSALVTCVHQEMRLSHVVEDFTEHDKYSVLANFHKTLQREDHCPTMEPSMGQGPGVGLFRGRCRSLSISSPSIDHVNSNAQNDLDFSFAEYYAKLESHLFGRAFVSAVHAALVANVPIHADDINEAVECRCEEFPLEVDLSNHLPVLCTHMSRLMESPEPPEDDCSSFTLTIADHDLLDDVAHLPICTDHHESLTSAFTTLVSSNFGVVPFSDGLFYLKPSKCGALDDMVGDDTCGESSVTSDNAHDDTVQFVSLNHPVSETNLSAVNLSDDSETLASICSSTTNDLDNIVCESDVAMGNYAPVFLQLTCSIHVDDKYVSLAVSQVPTCVVPLLERAHLQRQGDESITHIKIYLHLCVLTTSPVSDGVDLSQQVKLDIENVLVCDDWMPLCRQVSFIDSSDMSVDLQRQIASIADFPKRELSVIVTVLTGVESLIREESIFRQTRTACKQLGEEKLNQVVTHLANEATIVQVPIITVDAPINTPRPVVTDIPFHFVMKEGASNQRLRQLLKNAAVDYVTLNACENHLYACFVEDYPKFLLMHRIEEVVEEMRLEEIPCSEPANYLPQEIAHPTLAEKAQEPIVEEDNTKTITPTNFGPRSQSFSGFPDRMKLQRARMSALSAKDRIPDTCASLLDVHKRRLFEGESSWRPFAVPLSSAQSMDSQMWDGDATTEGGGMTTVADTGSAILPAVTHRQTQVYADFWLIVSIFEKHARVYFHEKDQGLHTPLFYSCVAVVRKLVERVNQEMLLAQLYETKKVDDLLIAPKLQINLSTNEFVEEVDEEANGEGLVSSAVHHFPGSLACPLVWCWWINIHCRLKTMNRTSGRVHGALRNFLNKFGVNRENVYVFRENSPKQGVVYLRVHDSHQSCKYLSVKQLLASFKQQVGDVDEHEKPEKQLAKAFDKAVLVAMHGVEEPGEELTSELKNLLQSRLDEAVVTTLSEAFVRHPNCRLTADDVHFLQPDVTHPTCVAQLSLPPMAITHLHEMSEYLRQHLLSIMHSPYYINPTLPSASEYPIAKFKPYGRQHANQHAEEGTSYVSHFYLYNRESVLKKGQRHCGRKGLACVNVSLVDMNGECVGLLKNTGSLSIACDQLFPHPLSNTNSQDLLPPFKQLVACNCMVVKGRRVGRRGPPAVVQVVVWERGEVGMQDLLKQVHQCLTLALCDVVTESALLSSSITITTRTNNTGVTSEPGSPNSDSKKGGKSQVRVGQTHPDLRKRHSSAAMLPHTTINYLTEKSKLSRFTFDEITTEKDPIRAGTSSPAATSTPNFDMEPVNIGRVNRSEKYLNPALWGVGSCWLQFAAGFGLQLQSSIPSPCVTYFSLPLKCQSQIPTLIHEIGTHRCVVGLLPIYDCLFFESVVDQLHNQSNYRETNLDKIKHIDWTAWDCKNCVLLVGMSDPSSHDISVASNDSTEVMPDRSPQRFPPPLCGAVPRRRYLMMSVTSVALTVQTYNWSEETYREMETVLSKLVCWFNARSALSAQTVLHKMGITHLGNTASAELLRRNSYMTMYWVEAETMHQLQTPLNVGPLQRVNMSQLEPGKRKLFCPYYDDDGRIKPGLNESSAPVDVERRLGCELVERRSKMRCKISEQVALESLHECWSDCTTLDPGSVPLQVHIDSQLLQLVVSRSRLEHFVYTPLLFSKEWRSKVAQVRQPNKCLAKKTSSDSTLTPSRGRHASGNVVETNGAVSPRASVSRIAERNDAWHSHLQSQLIHAYCKHLQSLGMCELVVDKRQCPSDSTEWFAHPKCCEAWLEKTTPGGMIIARLFFNEPYFVLHIYVHDINHDDVQVSDEFHGEWSWLVARTHIHSFSYDFHLRMVAAYLSGVGGDSILFRPGYDMHAFLNDFLQYYQCRPAFGSNCIYEERLCVESEWVGGETLFDYLLDHEKSYGLNVVRMRVTTSDKDTDSQADYLLVSSHYFTHGGEQYMAINVILHDRSCVSKAYCLTLKFYVIFVCIEERVGMVDSEDIAALRHNSTNSILKPSNVGDLKRMDSFHQGVPLSRKLDETEEGEESSCDEEINTSNEVTLSGDNIYARKRAASGSELTHPLSTGRFSVFKVNGPSFSRCESVEGEMLDPDELGPVQIQRRASAAASIEAVRVRHKLSIQRSAPRRHRKSNSRPPPLEIGVEKDLSLLQRERVTWVAFVSDVQQRLQQALECQVTRFRTQLNRTVSEASWHCRRDTFWTRLVSHNAVKSDADPSSIHKTKPDLNTVFSEPSLTAQEFEVLLSNVQVVPAEELDPRVLPLFQSLSAHSTVALMHSLIAKYGVTRCRYVTNHSKQYLIVVNAKCVDTCFLVTADKAPSSGGQCKLALVYKDLEHFNAHNIADQYFTTTYLSRKMLVNRFFEDIFSCIAFHVWSKILS